MAFHSKVRGVLKHTTESMMMGGESSTSAILQAFRCMSSQIFIKGFSPQTTDDTLRQKCEQYGAVHEATIIYDHKTGQSRGFGFVTFDCDEAARSAIEALHGQDCDGRRLKVIQARALDRAASGGGGGYKQGGGGYDIQADGDYEDRESFNNIPDFHCKPKFEDENGVIVGHMMGLMVRMEPETLFREFLKTNVLKKNRLLALDVGEKHVGVALSNLDYQTSSPLTVMYRPNDNIPKMLSDLILKESVTGLVIGCPFKRAQISVDDDNPEERPQLFIAEICNREELRGVKYTYWNEAFTSKSMDYVLSLMEGSDSKQLKKLKDAFSAGDMEQDYLDIMNRIVRSS